MQRGSAGFAPTSIVGCSHPAARAQQSRTADPEQVENAVLGTDCTEGVGAGGRVHGRTTRTRRDFRPSLNSRSRLRVSAEVVQMPRRSRSPQSRTDREGLRSAPPLPESAAPYVNSEYSRVDVSKADSLEEITAWLGTFRERLKLARAVEPPPSATAVDKRQVRHRRRRAEPA